MSKPPKTSLKLPIFLIIGPALGVVLAIILYAIINFVFAGMASEPTSTSGVDLPDSASIAQGAESEVDLFGEQSVFQTISNVLLFLLGSISMLAFVPCLVFGIIILNKRRKIQSIDTHTAPSSEAREWRDLE